MKKTALVMLLVLLAVSCESTKENKIIVELAPENLDVSVVPHLKDDTVLLYSLENFESSVSIKMPEAPFIGTILVLQGWNFPNSSWSDSSNLEQLASDAGFALVMPDMGKSIYHKKVYPETRKDWSKFPTRSWLIDTLLADLNQQFHLFSGQANNFVMGLSTGGRGAFIIAQENPDIFSAGASLSGDYDQSAFPEDNLYRGYFGTHPEKWNPQENPVSFARRWKVPMYFSHGTADSIVPVMHQRRLQSVSDSVGVGDNWQFHYASAAGHDYHFWSSQVAPIIDYFKGFTNK